MRTYSRSVSAIASEHGAAEEATRRRAADLAIDLIAHPASLRIDGDSCDVVDAAGDRKTFDAVYPVLGSKSQSQLAVALGAEVDDNGELLVSRQQMSSVQGIYVAGDVVSAINQIAVAVGHASIAATAIHNGLPMMSR
jgi:thioredoxin reductase (NADPH)